MAYCTAMEGLLIELNTVYFKIARRMPTIQLEASIFSVLNVVTEPPDESEFFGIERLA